MTQIAKGEFVIKLSPLMPGCGIRARQVFAGAPQSTPEES
jgi:hypothetical protein